VLFLLVGFTEEIIEKGGGSTLQVRRKWICRDMSCREDELMMQYRRIRRGFGNALK
jgi:hypothetical protein